MQSIRFKGLLVVALELFFVCSLFAAVPAQGASHLYWLDYAGQKVRLTSAHETVAAILADNYLQVLPGDQVQPDLGAGVGPDSVIRFRPGSHVVVRDGNLLRVFDGEAASVREVLGRTGVALEAGNEVFPELDAAITPGLEIWVLRGDQRANSSAAAMLAARSTYTGYAADAVPGRRSVGLLLDDGGRTEYRRVVAGNVAESLAAAGISLRGEDRVAPALDQPVADGATITITRVDHSVVTVRVTVPHAVHHVPDPNAWHGTSTVLQNGQDGLDEVVEEVVLENGVEVGRQEISRRHLVDPVAAIVADGTRLPRNALPANPDYTFSRQIGMRATAYSAPGGYTASGRPATYGAVAVDPNVIPLGTHLYVEGYGFAWAADTGSAIKGNRVDLCFDTYDEARQYGVEQVQVWVLDQ
ncbi:MAG: 3D domain-containing protein [Candidatus Dormibacteria bacterium]